jgi:autotransporter-associated beta strand protein
MNLLKLYNSFGMSMKLGALGLSGLFPVKRAGTLALVLLGMTRSQASTPPLPVIPTNQYNILNYGGYGNGVSNNTAAIQTAINTAAATGGTVVIPAAGTLSTYMCGPFNLTNSLNLQISSGAMLKMFPMATFTNFPNGTNYFINANKLHDIEISGSGTIEGQGTNWWVLVGTTNEVTRPTMININASTRVLLQDVTLQNPPASHCAIKGTCVSVTVQGVTVNTPGDSHNTDAIDLASTNCLIRNCSISCGDDNIAIGSSAGVSADILVTNCAFGNGHGVSIGSYTSSGVQNLIVSNCSFTGTDTGIRLKSQRDRGGLVKNLRYMDITMTNVQWPVIMYSYYQYGIGTLTGVTPYMASTNTAQTVTSTTPIWRDVILSNVTATTTGSRPAILIWGLPEMLISNVTFCHVNITASKPANIYNAQAIRFIDSQINVPGTTNTFNLYRADITVTNSSANTNWVTVGGLAVPPTNNLLAFFNGQVDINETNVLGAGPITLGGTALTFSQDSVSFSNTPLSVVTASTITPISGSNTFSGALSGSGPLTLALTNSNILWTLQGDCSGFTGTLAVTNNGTLRFNQDTNTWGGANAIFDAGSSGIINNRSTNGTAIFLGALTGGSGSKLRGSDQAGPGLDQYVIGGLNSNTTFAGAITNGTSATTPHIVALTKIGTGTFTLSGNNSYSGGTTVSNGTLLVNNTSGSGMGTGAVTVASSATLSGGGTIGGPVTVNGTLAPGSSVGTLTINHNLVVNGGAILQYALGTNSDLTVVSSNLTVGGTLNVTDAGGLTTTNYTLFTCGGALTYTGISIGTAPSGYNYAISTNTPGQVNLEVTPILSAFQQWQVNYFGSTNNPAADSNEDPDGDGQNNLAEYLAGTSPTNSASALRIISTVQQSNDILISWTTAGGRTNAVQAGPGDTSGGYSNDFVDISGLMIMAGSGDVTTNYVDGGGATNKPSRYYRIRLVP